MFFSATSANIINHSASGKMPAPQSLCWWMEQASCLLPIRGRQDACPTISLPVEQASCLSLKILHQA